MARWTLDGPEDDLLTAEQVCAYCHFERKRLYELVRLRRFPAPIDFGGKRSMWRGVDVACYVYLTSRLLQPGEELTDPDEAAKK